MFHNKCTLSQQTVILLIGNVLFSWAQEQSSNQNFMAVKNTKFRDSLYDHRWLQKYRLHDVDSGSWLGMECYIINCKTRVKILVLANMLYLPSVLMPCLAQLLHYYPHFVHLRINNTAISAFLAGKAEDEKGMTSQKDHKRKIHPSCDKSNEQKY